jgi:predicted CXXCH cytochrome family protein
MKKTVFIIVFATLLLGGVYYGSSQKPADTSSSPSTAISDETCQGCHKAEATQFRKTAHAHNEIGGKGALSCETCHGTGKAHVDAEQAAHGDDAKTAAANKLIFSFKGPAKENSDRCLSCHITGKLQQGFNHSEHAAQGVSCNTCHSAHLVNETKDLSKGGLPTAQAQFFQIISGPDDMRWLRNSLLKSPQPQLCYACHGTIQAQFALPVHHRVPEGSMKCTDCHNSHGTPNASNLIKPGAETCTQCHVEKHGPFVYEHPAGKIDGCITCHNPHGSVNRMLLVRREGRQLCLQCHSGFSAQASVPHGRLSYQTSGECVRCHVTIHGSNFDVNFLR